ncbi:MAG: acetate--CoA ligase family protein [Deltaproteobacteria bacterium]|nr:acetate--CoA ligase family protein [Deltaproteobacteria bacterium]
MAHTLSEYESKRVLREYGVPTVREALVPAAQDALAAAAEIGFPVALKLCGGAIAHKTERNLVRLNLVDEVAVEAAAQELLGRRRPQDGEVGLLVQAMVSGRREIIVGMVRDPQFGPCVMLGLGGILAEALRDVVFRMAPLNSAEGSDMIAELKASHVLSAFRGEPPVDREALSQVLIGVGRLGLERPAVRSLDINPLIIAAGKPVAVDALIEVAES